MRIARETRFVAVRFVAVRASFFIFCMNPLLSREIRERFRDGRAFVPLLVLVGATSLLFVWIFAQNAGAQLGMNAGALNTSLAASRLTGRAIFTALAWCQTLGWLLLAPALTSSAIAYERERGWFDSLLLSPLSPRQVVLGKWAAALLYAVLLYAATLPFMALTLLLGGVSPRQFGLILLLHAACALCGSAVGLAASAWSPRASGALRTAQGLIFLGFGASLFGAAAAGELPFRFLPVPGGNAFFTFLGRTNPVLRAVEISGDLAFQRTGVCLLFLGALTLFFLAVAVYYAGKPLEEAPFIERPTRKSTKDEENETPETRDADLGLSQTLAPQKMKRATHAEIPIAARLRFSNPVLGREVRAKFRLRQPPLAVILSEIVLGILVALFYAQTFYWALFKPAQRELIWWGLCISALIVSMMAASVMGSNALSREREGGTWESVQLSLLQPAEILRGKVFASLLTVALFSLPVYPLLLPCITWNAGLNSRGGGVISPLGALSCLAIWAATMWSYTLIGMTIGFHAPRTGRASGQTLGVLSGFLLLWPFLIGPIASALEPEWGEISSSWMTLAHPLMSVTTLARFGKPHFLSAPFSFAVPFCALHFLLGIALWFWLRAALSRELLPAQFADKSTTVEAKFAVSHKK